MRHAEALLTLPALLLLACCATPAQPEAHMAQSQYRQQIASCIAKHPDAIGQMNTQENCLAAVDTRLDQPAWGNRAPLYAQLDSQRQTLWAAVDAKTLSLKEAHLQLQRDAANDLQNWRSTNTQRKFAPDNTSQIGSTPYQSQLANAVTTGAPSGPASAFLFGGTTGSQMP